MSKYIFAIGVVLGILFAGGMARPETQLADKDGDKYYDEAKAEQERYREGLIEKYSKGNVEKGEILRKAAYLVRSIKGQESESLLLKPVIEYVAGDSDETGKKLIAETLVKSYNKNYLWHDLVEKLAVLQTEYQYHGLGMRRFGGEYNIDDIETFERIYSSYRHLSPTLPNTDLNEKEQTNEIVYNLIQAWQRYELSCILDKLVSLVPSDISNLYLSTKKTAKAIEVLR